jgi:hypothetical protein
MFGKNKLQKILALMADLTDEELEELSQKADEMKDTPVDEPSEDVESPAAEMETPAVETETPEAEEADQADGAEATTDEPEEDVKEPEGEPDKLGEVMSAIEAVKETVTALASRMDAYDQSKEAERNDFEFGIAGTENSAETKKSTLDELKEKHFNFK